ncbi:hypothetical protein TARUN_7180 [Trichoderma arundinaceum]|uniref:Uncharacterized protein n=1 Tax=Trichoderma arundinaceum TaxID=490622 RepID=A0A395NG59_TRIAR|nr:hypothetical protein TARUN_7180 [Trichoderma arundinaceum]
MLVLVLVLVLLLHWHYERRTTGTSSAAPCPGQASPREVLRTCRAGACAHLRRHLSRVPGTQYFELCAALRQNGPALASNPYQANAKRAIRSPPLRALASSCQCVAASPCKSACATGSPKLYLLASPPQHHRQRRSTPIGATLPPDLSSFGLLQPRPSRIHRERDSLTLGLDWIPSFLHSLSHASRLCVHAKASASPSQRPNLLVHEAASARRNLDRLSVAPARSSDAFHRFQPTDFSSPASSSLSISIILAPRNLLQLVLLLRRPFPNDICRLRRRHFLPNGPLSFQPPAQAIFI